MSVARAVEAPESKAWEAWYRFARDTLAFHHEEAVEYANHRFVEEQNRASLRLRASQSMRSKSR
jgi:hypothetical protein